MQEKNKYDEAIAKAREKFQPEADQKYELLAWLSDAYSKVKPNVTTHPAKFTNPKISNATALLFYGLEANNGYVKTGNVRLASKVDVSGNSATNTIIFELYTLLARPLKNGNSLINQFENDDADLIEFFKSINIEYKTMKAKCLEVFYGKNSSQSTHEQIKQIYFPLEDEINGYHLLSVVTPSMLMYEAKNRIDAYDRWVDGQHVRKLKKDNKFYSEGFDEILGLTEIGFSHTEFTKMGNVSYLNVRNKGIAYLLASVPPNIKQRDIRLPTHNFFRNSLRIRSFKDTFQSLDKLIKTDVNNVHVREGISNSLKYIIDQVLQRAFKVRAYGVGWSNSEHYQALPLAQRIWLDDVHLDKRENEDEWLKSVVGDFARWILDSYEYLFKEIYTKLSDHELREVRGMVQQAVSNDQEFFK
ncbi:MAG: type I-F CRISPR-associated protein Csy1 [Methylococcales bacterium]